LALCGFAANLGAQSLLNIEFGAGSHSLKTGFAATGQTTNDFWNLFRLYDPKYTPGMAMLYNGRLPALKLADGTATDVSIDVTNAPGVWGNSTGDPMYDSYVFAPDGSNIVVTLSQLEPGRYNIYLYGHADADASGEQTSVFKIHSAGTNYGPLTTLSTGAWKAAMPWQENQQYVVFRDVLVRAGTPVVIDVMPGPNGIAVLNGLQVSSKGTSPPRLVEPMAASAAAVFTNLVIREIRYDGNVNDHEARFDTTLQIESLTTNDISAPLFQGDVAVTANSLPAGVRITRTGDQYFLRVNAPGAYDLKLEVVAKITRAEPWNQVSFQGPAAGIASIRAQAAGEGVEMQLLSGTALDNEKAASHVEGFLSAGREVSLRWQSKAAEVARNALITVETTSGALVTPAVIKLGTTLHYELLQANVPSLRIALPPGQSLTKQPQGEQIRTWEVVPDGARSILTVEFIKPIEKKYELALFTEQAIGSMPLTIQITAPQPLDIERESGSFSVSASDTVVDVTGETGLRRVNATGDALAAFQFSARPFLLTANVKRVEPVLTVADRVTARLEESRLLVSHLATITVEKAGIYSIEFTPPTNFVVTAVRSGGVEQDWKVAEGKLRVAFAGRVLGTTFLDVQLEQALKTFPAQITLAPLRATGAAHDTALIGVAAAPGLRVRTGEMTGAREIPVAQLGTRAGDEVLAYNAAQADWTLTLATERLPARIGADIFNLITIGDGVVGGSATVRYDLVNQGVQEFHLTVPAHWKNVEFTGFDIRSREQQSNAWTIHLQEKAWNGYTLVVTYDYQFDATNAVINAAGLHSPEAEHETGSVAITTAASVKLTADPVSEPLRVIDQTELAESDRALVTRPVLKAYHYTGHDYQLKLNVTRQPEEAVLDAVADHTQLTSALTDSGEMLTQASFMVKNNGKQFQRFQLPPGANFWGCYVDGQSSKAETNADWLLVPLPQRANRDEAFAVDIVYAQGIGVVKDLWIPRNVALEAPKTDLPNTFAEWEVYPPADSHFSSFAGSMTVARDTAYGLREAWRHFCGFYGDLFSEYGMMIVIVAGAVLVLILIASRLRAHSWAGVVTVLLVLLALGILVLMTIPNFVRARTTSQANAAINNLRIIDGAKAQYALEHQGSLPTTMRDLIPYTGRGAGAEGTAIGEQSGEEFVYDGSGKQPGDHNAIIAYSPEDREGRFVLRGDGAIEKLSRAEFAAAEQRDAASSHVVNNYQDSEAQVARLEARRYAEEAGQTTNAAIFGGGGGGRGGRAGGPGAAAGGGFGGGAGGAAGGGGGGFGGGGAVGRATSGATFANQPANAAPAAPAAAAMPSDNAMFSVQMRAAATPPPSATPAPPPTLAQRVPQAGGPGAPGMPTQAGIPPAGVEYALVGGSVVASTAPTAAGLRSIHIEIPKHGKPFTFTKVLNTGGKPLDIRMSVMNARVYNVVRSGVQVAAFLLGLLLIWGQRRNRGSFIITIGTALALCAVAELLITGRVLHYAFIAAVPVLVLIILIALLRKVWPRKAAAAEKEKAEIRNGKEPPSPPIVPPVVASIALLLLLAHSAQAQDLESWMDFDNTFALPANSAGARATNGARIATLQSAIRNPQSAITSASYTGVIGEKVAQFDGTIALTSVSTNQTLPLFGSEVALQDFSVKSGEARLLRVGDRLGVFLPNRGDASITVKFVVKLGGDVSKRQLNFAIPPALSSTFNAVIDEADAEVEFPTAVSFQHTQADKQTRIAATIGPEDRVEILWTPRTKKANEVAATIFADNNSLVTLANGVMDVRSTLEYQISQGELRQARVSLPQDQRLLRVEGDSIRTWQVQAPNGDVPGGGVILTVDLLKGVSPSYKLFIETEKIMDSFPVTAAVAIPRALDVKRETGLMAARSGEELSLSVEHAVDLQRVDAGEFPRSDSAGTLTGTLFSVWRFLNPGFDLALKAETVQPQIEAIVHNNVKISPSQVALSATIDYTIKRAGVFALQIALPAGYTLDPVTGVTGNNILQWHPRDAAAGAGQILDVSFKNRLLGAYSLRLELQRPHTNLPPTVAIPGVQPLDMQKLSGFISVTAEPGVSAKTTNFDALTEIPGASLGSGANGAAGVLAYKFLSATPGPAPDWKLDVACEKIDPWVRVEIAQITSVSDNLLNGLAIVHYDIQNAPVKEFRFKIPAVYTNIEFNCPNLRRRDQNTTNGEWTVEVQNPVFGQFQFQITWEKPVDLKTNTLDLPPIQALGVERESGFVAVSGKKALQVAEQSSSGELVKIDASELPDWAYGVQSQALTWRYIRPGYTLSVRAERFADAAVLQALAEQVNLTSVVADDGQSMTELRLVVRNNGLQDLEVELPANSTVWSAFVGGEAVRPAKSSQGKLLLPLEASDAAADAPVTVELTYIVPEKFPSGRGEVNLISPRLNMPLNNARWDVYLPPDYDYQKFAGSMIHEAQAAPEVQNYSLSEYRAQEAEKKQAKQAETSSFISKASQNAAISNIRAIDQTKLNNLYSSDSATRNEIEAVKQELNYQNAANISQQNGRVFANPGQIGQSFSQSLNDSQFRQAQSPAQSDVQKTALDQWNKLAQAQQLAVVRVEPLRVNLPTRGVHFAFTQILQTEVQKPLTIQFTAANTRTGGLIGRLAGGVLGLAVLWILVQILLNRLPRNEQTA
jgi:competence protein ComGC